MSWASIHLQPTHLLPHCDVAPAEQQPAPDLDPWIALAEDKSGLYMRKCLRMHACALKQLTQEEASWEVDEREACVVVEERRFRLWAVVEKSIEVEGPLGSDQPSQELVCQQEVVGIKEAVLTIVRAPAECQS